jgi:hypothetical protein
MSDPNRDWLEEELKTLPNLEAPTTLLPKVMNRVRERAAKRWWVRLMAPHAAFLRTFVLGFSLFLLIALLVVNPVQFLSHVPGASALLNLFPLLLETAEAALFQAKIFNFSVLGLLVPTIVLSYILLVATASAIQHLAGARK